MKPLLRYLGYLAVLAFASTIVMEASMVRRATLVQFVRRSDTVWETIGEPLEVLDVPSGAIVQNSPSGAATLVDADKLAGKPLLEMRTVRGTAALARVCTLLAAIALLLGSNLLDRFNSNPTD